MGRQIWLISQQSRMDCKEAIDFDTLVEGLLAFFQEGKESVDIDEVIAWFNRYGSKPEDWLKFAKWDKYKYTRNLMHEGNGNFNMILMCWPEGSVSPIHDHADAHCFMRVLEGEVKEIRYHWPHEMTGPDGSLVESGTRQLQAPGTIYMSDELGLHKVENPSHTNRLCSIHLYSPPFKSCKIFDERTTKPTRVPMVFYSKFGEREYAKKSKAAKVDQDQQIIIK